MSTISEYVNGQYNMRRVFMGHVKYELKFINLAAHCGRCGGNNNHLYNYTRHMIVPHKVQISWHIC